MGLAKAHNSARTKQLTYWFDAFLMTLSVPKSQNSAIPALEQKQKVGLLTQAQDGPLSRHASRGLPSTKLASSERISANVEK